MVAAEYSAVPQRDEASSSFSSPTRKQSYLHRVLSKASELIGTTKGERLPLINSSKGTLDLPRKTRRKIIATVIGIVSILVILGSIVAFVVNRAEETDPAPKLPTSDPERIIVETPSAESLRNFLKIYTSEPHLAGTPADKHQAEWTRDKLTEFGITDTQIETYYPLLNYPLERRLAMVSGPAEFQFEASLTEDPVEEDETSMNPNVTPTFHGYSKNGTALGPVVYANYGRLEDFQFLVDQGIQLNGTIALMRYGGAFRGLKLRAAEFFGCIGALVYSDPIDDGPMDKENYPHVSPAKGYPDGPWRSPSSAQRGSVQYASLITGDPTTPGWAATEDAERIERDESPGMTQIPSLPLSYRDALPLLKATHGRGVHGDVDWAGGLEGVDYSSGPSEGNVYLVNKVEDKITPIWNVIGRIQGREEPERAVILGNHRDAWVYGAVDPSSGSAVLLELARTFGVLLKSGWRPRRTIILASWDAEEYGMVGSTEWVEDHREWLYKEAVAYLNMDVAVSGPHFTVQATPSLNRLLYQVTQTVPDPRSAALGWSVFEAWANRTGTPMPAIQHLGSGFGFVSFSSHVGIPSLDFGFFGDYGVYHSVYDSFHWMEKFGDPTFEYHQAVVRIWGLLAFHLADDQILPLYPSDYAAELHRYLDRLSTAAAAADSRFDSLAKAIGKLAKRTRRFERKRQRLEERLKEFADQGLPNVLAKRMAKTNKRLTYFERGFIDPEGIKGREWFKHVVYAPGLWTGYASQEFPAIVEAIEANDPEQIKDAVSQAAKGISAAAKWLKVD